MSKMITTPDQPLTFVDDEGTEYHFPGIIAEPMDYSFGGTREAFINLVVWVPGQVEIDLIRTWCELVAASWNVKINIRFKYPSRPDYMEKFGE